jgi:hypothetical protein
LHNILLSDKEEPLSFLAKESGKFDVLKIDVEEVEKEIIADVDSSKKNCFERIIIECHHKIGEKKSALSECLNTLS